MRKKNQSEYKSIAKILDEQNKNSSDRQYDPTHRGRTPIQGENIPASGNHRERQPEQTLVPDSELNGV